ncbi:MAG: phospholipase D family protein [Opitutae bacterium]|nr:phospholipase D family protein [Opitutae bacterium]
MKNEDFLVTIYEFGRMRFHKKHFSFLLIILLFASCRTQTLPELEPFVDNALPYDLITNGTSDSWKAEHEKVLSTGKPRALLLDHGEESLILRINLIRSAKKSILIQTFSWEFDEVGKFILWELIRANQDRGVKVQLLIDHMFNEHQPEMIAFLSTLDPNFEIKYFNPSAKKLSPSFLEKFSDIAIDFHDHNARLHNKLLLVDDFLAVTGGRNINNHYFDQVIGMNYKDRDVLVVLPDTKDILECFKVYWTSDQSIHTKELIDVREIILEDKFSKSVDKNRFFDYNVFVEISLKASGKSIIETLFIHSLVEVDHIEWIYDLPDKVDKAPDYNSAVSQRLLGLMQVAEEEIIIQSPYVVLSTDTQKVFRELRNKDVKVVISTNSLAATDNWATYAANYNEKRVYLEDLKLKMWEFKPIPSGILRMMSYEKLLRRKPFEREYDYQRGNNFNIKKFFVNAKENPSISGISKINPYLHTAPFLSLHAKSSVIDDKVSFIGSFNLDPRSEIYNTELGLIIHDEQFSLLLKKSIQSDISPENSYLIGIKKNRPLLSLLNKFLYRFSEAIPFIDLWPIRPHASFELKSGGIPVESGNKDFFKNWKNVGNFPGLSFFAKKQISARIFKATGMIFKPLL